jgi:alkylation response protein AidB-like acyl-CoA dehydrogenase
LFAKAAELGLTGVALPDSEGGAGFDHISYTIVIEEISRCCASTGVILSVQNSLYCDPIHRYGTEEQKKKFLLPFARGEKIGCYALTEPQAGSNAAALQTKAVKRGERYVMNGTKAWITNGGAADAAIVYVNTDPAKKRGSWESARPHAASWSLPIAKCRNPIASATKARVTKWLCRRWTAAASASPLRPPASHKARSKRR